MRSSVVLQATGSKECFMNITSNRSPSSLSVEYVLVDSKSSQPAGKPKTIKFSFESVISLESPPSQLHLNNLYELRSQHQVIDCVGCLQGDKEKDFWLVFIQVSLQAYKEHRKMCDLFHKPTSKQHTNKNNCLEVVTADNNLCTPS